MQTLGGEVIFRHAGDPILVSDLENRVVTINEPAERLFTPFAEAQEGVGAAPPLLDVYPAARLANDAKFSAFLAQLRLAKESELSGELVVVDPLTGRTLFLLARASQIEDELGRPQAVVTVLRDVTVGRELEHRRREHENTRIAQLQELNRAKSDFLNLASHELRTPLSVIRGYSSMLLDGTVGEIPTTARTAVATMQRKVEELNNIVQDLLEVSRQEEGRSQLNLKPVSLPRLLASVLDSMKPLLVAAETDLRLRPFSGPSELTRNVMLDEDKAKIAITNLLDNARKFNPPRGRIEVRPSVLPSLFAAGNGEAGDPQIVGTFRFEVTDFGPGIAKSQQARLFQKFSRIDSPENRHIGGVGLGLYLVRTIAELHGGEAAVESEEGRGATFSVSLPLRRQGTAAPAKKRRKAPQRAGVA